MDLTFNMDKVLRITDEDVYKSLECCGISASQFNEGVQMLRRWYDLQSHLPQGYISDRKLSRHFITCRFSLEKTKRNIDSYFTARNIMPEFISNRDPTSVEIENVFQNCAIATFPQLTKEQYRVTCLKMLNADTSKWNLVDAFKLSFMIGDYRLMNDVALGDHFVVQFDNIRVGHLTQFTPSVVTKTLYYLQSCIGAKIKGVHLVGLPSYAEAIVNMFKKALSRKVAERFFTYSSVDELGNVFDKKILPSDMGGEDISTLEIMENWKQTLQSPAWKRWFLEQDDAKTDERKRDKSISNSNVDDIMGMHGSFRKLDVD